MKRQIRQGVWETNSSSTHSLTMCSKEDYDKWINGELIYDRDSEELIPISECDPEQLKEDQEREYVTWKTQYYTYNDFDNMDDYETFKSEHITPSGEEVIAFGYYGYDG